MEESTNYNIREEESVAAKLAKYMITRADGTYYYYLLKVTFRKSFKEQTIER